MRFTEDGPNVPDELIEEALAGRAVFLCGAGVSFRVGLPLFATLTERIYTALGETRNNDPAESDAFARKEYDRVLRALEKRLLRVGDRSRVRTVCAAELAPPRRDLPDHRALLLLSRDKNGRTRLLTTNFDTLFERAARRANLSVASHAVKAMPKPASVTDHGILHLHGRIADKWLRLAESDLILTSADFGDAYLRDGWASQYIEDRIRTGTLVLLGYQAEDAALRLLLETLDVDRERFPDLYKIYALDEATPSSKAIWDAKGIVAVEAADYDVLYQSVQEWARYAQNTRDYTVVRVAEILAKEPRDTTDFEREQLSFLIAHDDAASLLVANNPSLTWLPVLADLKLVGRDQPWLVGWLERNLEAPDAVRDVVANIALLGKAVGDVLDYRLEHLRTPLSEPYRTAWRLIVRDLKTPGRDVFGSGWFDIQPRLARGERGPDVLEEFAQLLLPRIKVSKRFSMGDDRSEPASDFRDLMSVDLETDENLDVVDILQSWPRSLPASDDVRLLNRLSDGLNHALDDAVALGLESEGESSATDADVPSVADHPQNEYRHGFLPIVRVMAEVWSSLASKDAAAARGFVTRWSDCGHKLLRRLALYASTDAVVPADLVAHVLEHLPADEYFFSNSTVELFRLLRTRWADLAEPLRRSIEQRFMIGPRAGAFREGAEVRRIIDRTIYQNIGNLRSWRLVLSAEANAAFDSVQRRYPEWQLQPPEQAGFHIWTGGVTTVGPADPRPLEGVSADALVETASRLDQAAPFGDGRNWTTLVASDPERALAGLLMAPDQLRWSPGYWRPIFWSKDAAVSPDFENRVAGALLQWPSGSFGEIAAAAADWLGSARGLNVGERFWPLWDKILAHLPAAEDNGDTARYFDQSINSAAGNLAEALLKKLPASQDDPSFSAEVEPRLDALFNLGGHSGVLAKIRLAADVAFLYARVPNWTAAWLLPVFGWDQPLALAAWSARRYANSIGSPELFSRTKSAFLALFERAEVPAKLKQEFADWLLVPLFSNQRYQAGYPLTMVEARGALRRAGSDALWQVGHRFAIEMEAAAPEEKLTTWRGIVGPVFRGTWPLDAELQTKKANFKLVQLLRATGAAFPEAVDDVIPFIAQEAGSQASTIFSLRDADAALYELAPRKLLDLVDAIVGQGEPGAVYGLRLVLDRLSAADPTVVGSPKYQRLLLLASRGA